MNFPIEPELIRFRFRLGQYNIKKNAPRTNMEIFRVAIILVGMLIYKPLTLAESADFAFAGNMGRANRGVDDKFIILIFFWHDLRLDLSRQIVRGGGQGGVASARQSYRA